MIKKFKFALAAVLCATAGLAAADEFADYRQAGVKLSILPQPARAASPEAAPLFAVLADNRRFLDSRSFTQADIPSLFEMCDTATSLVSSYMMLGIDGVLRTADGNQQKLNEAVLALAAHNTREYQQELALLMPFAHRCNGRTFGLMEEFLAGLPPAEVTEARLDGARQIQQGAFNNFVGIITMMTRKEMDEANVLRLARAMADSAPAYIAVLPLAKREEIAGLASQALPQVSGEQAAILAKVIESLQDRKCGKLCMVPGK